MRQSDLGKSLDPSGQGWVGGRYLGKLYEPKECIQRLCIHSASFHRM
jgi:hypothetical protein